MSVHQEIQASIKGALPSLDNAIVERLATKLIEEDGMESLGDLEYIEEKDLIEILKPIQCRKLMKAWKPKGNFLLLIHNIAKMKEEYLFLLYRLKQA